MLGSEVLKEMQKRIVMNFLDTIVLAKLANSKPMSGYDVINFVHEEFDVLISSGTVYSLLYSMERKGLINGEWNVKKRVYILSDKGAETINTILNSKPEIQKIIRNCISEPTRVLQS